MGQKGHWTGKKRPGFKLSHSFTKGFTPWNKGKKTSPEVIEKLRTSHIGQKAWNKGLKNHLSVEVVEKIRQSVLANPGKNFRDTKPEMRVESELSRLGIFFEKQRSLCKVAKVDFYLPEHHIAIQVDGCYWHNCSIHSATHLDGKSERDSRQDAILAANGFNVYRIWEHDIMEDGFDLSNFIKY